MNNQFIETKNYRKQKSSKMAILLGISATLLLCVVAISIFCINYYDVEWNNKASKGLRYKIVDGEAIINGMGECQDSEIIIPSFIEGKKVTSIGDGAFNDCSSLTSVIIPDGVKIIGSYAFANCEALTSITIPNSVKIIGGGAFVDCGSLKGVHISDIVSWCNISFKGWYSNPLRYAGNLYIDNQLVTDLVIPNIVTRIGNYSFAGYKGLTKIVIPDNVTSIGKHSFSGCKGLTDITIPERVKSLGDFAFEDCLGLTNVIIPNSVTSIGSRAFSGCKGLTSITIPEFVITIGDLTFERCIVLTQIIYNGTVEQWQALPKGTDWAIGTPDYTIYCTDGTITKSGTVTYN